MSEVQPEEHLVILIPGIRDVGAWINESRVVLEAAGFVVEGAQDNFFGVVGFLWPFPGARDRALRKVLAGIRQAMHAHPKATRVSFIAHSFGSYMLAEILDRELDLFRGTVRLENVIVCGSVLKDSFPFERIRQRIGGRFLADIGTHDQWPVIAETFSFIFGSAGTYGFKGAPVVDRYHQGLRHGSFFEGGFLARWWVPVLQGAAPAPGTAKPKSPWWFTLLTEVRHLLTGALTALLACLLVFAALAYLFPPEPLRVVVPANAPASLEQPIRLVESRMSEKCPLPAWLCWVAPLQPLLLARDYPGMRAFDDTLLRIELCDGFEYPPGGDRTTDPFEIAEQLSARFPQCMRLDTEEASGKASWTAIPEAMTPYTNSNGDRRLLCGCSAEQTRTITGGQSP